MKFTITLKDPDGVSNSLQEAAEEWANFVEGLVSEEHNDIVESRKGRLSKIIEKWFEHSEYVTLEIDTEAQTCIAQLAKP